MNNDNTHDDYEIGYGKPPKETQFQKGQSGNPKGRPKKSLDFNEQLLRETHSYVTVNENGRKKRISKHGVVIKQLLKQAMTGNIAATRTYLTYYQQASGSVAVLTPERSIESLRNQDPAELTDKQLQIIIRHDIERRKQESGMGHLSNAEFVDSIGMRLLRPRDFLDSPLAEK
jgi:Family of unknown function (DUF5681)